MSEAGPSNQPAFMFDKVWKFFAGSTMAAAGTAGGTSSIVASPAQSQCSFTDTTATLQNTAIRCPARCGAGESVRLRFRFARGEKLIAGFVRETNSQRCAAAAAPAVSPSSNNGALSSMPPGWSSVDSSPMGQPAGASVRCDGVTSFGATVGARTQSNEEGDDKADVDDTTMFLPLTENGPLFAPGQTVMLVLDRRVNKFSLGIETPYAAPMPLFSLPVEEDTNEVVNYHFVLAHYGSGSADVELLVKGAASPLSRTRSGTSLTRVKSFGSSGSLSSATNGTSSSSPSSPCAAAALLWNRDVPAQSSVYLGQRSLESLEDVDAWAEHALAAL